METLMIMLYVLLGVLAYVVLSYIMMSVLYASYVVLMDRIAIHGRESKTLKALVTVFIIYDVLCDVVVMNVWGLQLRIPSTVTARLRSWRSKPDFSKLNVVEKKRFLFAVWLCDGYLDRDDVLNYRTNAKGEKEGDHC